MPNLFPYGVINLIKYFLNTAMAAFSPHRNFSVFAISEKSGICLCLKGNLVLIRYHFKKLHVFDKHKEGFNNFMKMNFQ